MRKCSALKANGERCRGIAATGSDSCPAHDPRRSEQRRANARAAARSGRGGGSQSVAILKIKQRLEQIADAVLGGQLEPKAAAVGVQAMTAQLRCISLARELHETVELERRLERLEALDGSKRSWRA